MNKNQKCLVTILLAALMTTTILPFAFSATNMRTQAFLSAAPKTVGSGQQVLFNGWIEPPPDIGWLFSNVYIDIKKGDAIVTTLGPLTTDSPGTFWTTWTTTELGQYTAICRWAGGDNVVWETVRYGPQGGNVSKKTYDPCTSAPFVFTVQKDPVPPYPAAVLPGPNDYWTRPISNELREWSAWGGNWLYDGGFGDVWRPDDKGNKHVNPYSTAPKSSHIAWKLNLGPSGLAGDYSGDAASFGANPSINVIMGGVGYYQFNGLHAVDIQTGKELWCNTAQSLAPTFGQLPDNYYVPGSGNSMSQPSLWYVGSQIVRINAKTGANITVYQGSSGRATTVDLSGSAGSGGVMLYQTFSGSTSTRATWFVAWNSSKTGNTFAQKLAFNVSDIDAESGSGPYMYKDVVVLARSGNPNTIGYNAVTGKLLWNITRDYNVMSEGAVGYGKVFYPAMDGRVHAWDVYTGQEVWQSDVRDLPWGVFGAYSAACAYNMVYLQAYDGTIRAYDVNTGKQVWKYYSGDDTETPYNTLPFYGRPVIADGVVFAGQTEHSPTYPLFRGRQMFAFDAYTGQVLWSISGQYEGKAIADGVLVATDTYTGSTFAWGKGQTTTTVSASPKVANSGSKILIEGSVLDNSPAQPGTPAISKESMTQQMEYLHMNRPAPTNNTGVPVTLYALKSDGTTIINIGTTTTNSNGKFAITWTPPTQDTYTITASFAGDESYWSSWDTTGVVVTSAPANQGTTSSPSAIAEEPSSAMPTESLIAIGAAIVIIVAIAAAAILLRRRK